VKTTLAAAVVLALGAIAFVGIRSADPPTALPASAPDADFSAERAMTHLAVIARIPHPIGSAANAEVAEYIIKELTAMGLEPQTQQTTGVTERYSVAGSVRNIVARLNGTNNSRAVLLVSHYDSVASAPGAGDDGSGAAAMLETLRALKAGPPIRNDCIFLFTDGEEAGLLGAAAFVDDHPWAPDVGVALNFEARGTSGPSFMFETSSGNGWLVDQFARAAPHPNASSLTYALYQRLPNDTDFTLFKTRMPGLNFAFIGDVNNYHTPNDSLATISHESLQHHGSYQLALVRHFGNLSLDNISGNDAIYFTLPGILVYYPESLSKPLAILAAIVFIAASVTGVRRRVISGRGMAAGVAVALVDLVAIIIAGLAVRWLINWLHGHVLPPGDVAGSRTYFAAVVVLCIAVAGALHVIFRRRVGAANLAFGGLFVWAVLALMVSFMMAGASYIFTWPLLFGSLGLLAWFLGPQETISSPIYAGVMVITAIPLLLLLTPLIDSLFYAFGLSSMGTPVVLALCGITLLAVIPHVELCSAAREKALQIAAAALCLLLLMLGTARTRFNAGHPAKENITYALDGDTGEALWITTAATPSDWSAQYVTTSPQKGPLPQFLPQIPLSFAHYKAPEVRLPPPEVFVDGDFISGETRTLRLGVTSVRRAQQLAVYAPGLHVLSATVNGKTVEDIGAAARQRLENGWMLAYVNPPNTGIDLTLVVKAGEPVKLLVTDWSRGLPEVPGQSFNPRPPGIVPAGFGDMTIVSRTFSY
jgi:Peptidase family M28